MNTSASSISIDDSPSLEYEVAMADMERCAALSEISLAQAKREIFELREWFAGGEVPV